MIGLGIKEYKTAMFEWLEKFYVPCGRLRRAKSGRAYVKCNDCGVRLIEAQCGKSLEEWLEIKDENMEDLLVYEQVIGPEINFSPFALLQLTTFKCGGISLGLYWAHIIGDPFVASEFMSAMGPTFSGQKLAYLHAHVPSHPKPKLSPSPTKDPLSLKRVDPVGDTWKITNNCKMETFSFNLSAENITKLCENFSGKTPSFESICAIIWKCVAKVRFGHEPKCVTICKNGSKNDKRNVVGNGQVINVVEPEFSVSKASLDDIVNWLSSQSIEDTISIEGGVEKDQGLSDFIFYGANLTFLDLDGVDIYKFEIRGIKTVNVSCRIEGVGEEGVVLVFPNGKGGKVVRFIMPEDEVLELKLELKKEFETA